MSMFEDDRFQWRETYFVLFDSTKRPLLSEVEQAVRTLGGDLQLKNASADEDGRIESLTVQSAEDFAALDISYLSGDEVVVQREELAMELKKTGGADAKGLARLARSDARFDIMHFE